MEWSVSDNFLRNEFVRRVLVWNAPKTISYSHSQNQDKEWNENRKIYIYIISFIAAAGMEKCALSRTMCALENTQTPRNHQCDQDQWSEFYTRTLSLMLLLIEIIYDKFMIKLPFVLRVFFARTHIGQCTTSYIHKTAHNDRANNADWHDKQKHMIARVYNIHLHIA